VAERGRGLVGKARSGLFQVPDRAVAEVLDVPEVAVLADRPQVEAGDPERLGPDRVVPAIEPSEIQVARAVLYAKRRSMSSIDRSSRSSSVNTGEALSGSSGSATPTHENQMGELPRCFVANSYQFGDVQVSA
jgi:hypothetical protein